MVLLGANGISTLALVALAIRQTRQLPLDAETLAFAHLGHLAAFAARWLPAGAAWLLTLATALFGASLARSFAQAVHYEVWHTATQIGSRGGWINRFECRVPIGPDQLCPTSGSPRRPGCSSAGRCLSRRLLHAGAAALRLPLRRRGTVPGAAAGIPDATGRPADTTQRSSSFVTGVPAPFRSAPCSRWCLSPSCPP